MLNYCENFRQCPAGATEQIAHNLHLHEHVLLGDHDSLQLERHLPYDEQEVYPALQGSTQSHPREQVRRRRVPRVHGPPGIQGKIRWQSASVQRIRNISGFYGMYRRQCRGTIST